jgi:hypothetical protein
VKFRTYLSSLSLLINLSVLALTLERKPPLLLREGRFRFLLADLMEMQSFRFKAVLPLRVYGAVDRRM